MFSLERELRFPLLRRDRRGVELTAAGQTLLPAARRLLAEWEETLTEATKHATDEGKVLRVVFQTSVGGAPGPKLSSTHAALALYSLISPPTTRRRRIWCIGTGVGITPIVSGA